MNRQTLDRAWSQMRQKYGIYLRVLEAIPADRYHDHPIAGMRTPAALVSHVSGSIVRDIAQGVARGVITADESKEDGVADGLATRDDVVAFARRCWAEADEAVARIGDAELQALVPTPWGMTFPGWVGFDIMNDEFLHHRGQLYAYARACGGDPPFLWGFGDNPPGFGPES